MKECIDQALATLAAFESVGVKHFGLTRTNIDRQLAPEGYRCGLTLGGMGLLLPVWVRLSWSRQENLIIRAGRPACGVLAQLDDLRAEQLDRMRSKAFLAVETSPGNFQIWLAIEDGNEDFVNRLMKGIGSDSRANCAGRVAGSLNVKRKYEPNFPVVKIAAVDPGRRVWVQELESLGLVAPLETRRRAIVAVHLNEGDRGWPDYEKCLRGAPRKADGTADRSLADYFWCKWALERGHGTNAVLSKFLRVSRKAKEEWDRGNEKYAARTIRAAMTAK